MIHYQTATNISIGSSAVGVLDSPLDIDYYKVSVTKGYIMKYSYINNLLIIRLYIKESQEVMQQYIRLEMKMIKY